MKEFIEDIKQEIQRAYDSSVTFAEAEKLANKFLICQITLADTIAKSDLDSRMRKTGLKALRAAVYTEAATKGDKKPTEAALAATVDQDKQVMEAQEGYDTADVETAHAQNMYNICKEAHIYFRGLAKATFGG